MIRHRTVIFIFAIICFFSAVASMAAPGTSPLPLKPDPPPAIDGRLGEWSIVPGAWTLDSRNVTFGKSQWSSTKDLSAIVHLAWRQDYLYLVADVTDDVFSQPSQGESMWKGDNVELFVDTTPNSDTNRNIFGDGQFMIALSPGNFRNTGDAFGDIAPEAFMFLPNKTAAPEVILSSTRTENGYILEAAIPWKLLGITGPEVGKKLSIEVGVSDCDSDQPSQETMLTLLPETWERLRDRMVIFQLTGADGVVTEVPAASQLFSLEKIAPGEKKEYSFNLSSIPKGEDAVLTLLARLDAPKPAGIDKRMHISVNGIPLDARRLLNKEVTMETNDGRFFPMASGNAFTVFYAPDFTSADQNLSYGLKNAKACLYDLKITDLVKSGQNTVIIENELIPDYVYDLYCGEGKVEFRSIVKAKELKGPPTGFIPTIEPAKVKKVPYSVKKSENGDFTVSMRNEKFAVYSEFSTPAPGWVKGSNKYFAFSREVESRNEYIVVRDTFCNLTNENLPIMQRNNLNVDGLKKAWLAGLSPGGKTSFSGRPENPTCFGITEKSGIGLVALDDVSRVHAANLVNGNILTLADNEFVLRPKATYTKEWAVVLVQKPDYYDFINAIRRFMDVNFVIDGPFAGFGFRPDEYGSGSMSNQQITDYAKYKSAKFMDNAFVYPPYKGMSYIHAAGYLNADMSYTRSELARSRKAAPGVKFVCYFHCFLDQLEEEWPKYEDARILLPDGRQAIYSGQDSLKIFLPTENNAFGRDMAKIVDFALDDLHFDGIFWDELEYSAYPYHYGQPWDGVSADIDPRSMQIQKLKTSVALVSQNYRIGIAKRILSRGAPLLGNGAPNTRSMANVHFNRFTETGSISNCTLMHLYSPVALGDHLTEVNDVDSYKVMLRALDYGCVYYWYSTLIHPTHIHLTAYMYPITPIELHEGYIIGKERIITNRNGLFGWGDKSGHEVHVFNDQGKEVPNFKAKAIIKNGKTYTELRIGEGWSAAIVRKAK